MSLTALRALSLSVNMAAHGMPVTVTVAGEDAVETTGIWMTPETEEVSPGGGNTQRREAYRVLVLRRADVPLVPRGTIVVGAPHYGDSQRWRVDGTDRVEVDRVYVIVVPAPEE